AQVNVQANVGFDSSLQTIGPQGECDTQNITEKLTATFTPRARVDADGRLAVGIPGLSAGVKGSVMVVQLTAPVTASAYFSANGLDPVLNLHTDAALHAQLLSGRMNVYAQFLFDSVDKEVISWNAVPVDLDLWNETWQLPMSFIRTEFDP